MKRKISSLLLLAMLAASLAACGDSQSGTTADTTSAPISTEPVTEALTDGLPEVDMEGFEFAFCIPSPQALGWALIAIDSTEATGDLVNDAIYDRNRSIEERFNCKIFELQQNSGGSTPIINAVLAGDNTYKIAHINDESIIGAMTAGVLSNFADLPYVNLEKEWWNQSANEKFIINGVQYAALGDYNLSEYSKCYMLYFNKDLYAEIPQEKTVYEMVSDGTWTIENFIATAKQYGHDVNGDTVMNDEDRFGYSACSKVGMQLLITGAGVTLVDVDKNGDPYFAIPGNEVAIEKFQKLLNIFSGSGDWYYIGESALGGMQDGIFVNGHSVFQAASIWQTETYRSIEFDIGMLPAPKYDEKQAEYRTITASGVLSAIPKTLSSEDMEKVSILLEAMAFDSRQNLLPLYKQTVLQGKYARDDESMKIIDIIFDSMVFDPGVLIWADARRAFLSGPFHTLDDTIASTTESIKGVMEESIAKSIEAFKNA